MKLTEKLPIINKLGLHLRAAAELVKTANKFKSQIFIHHGVQNVNSKSLMGLMTPSGPSMPPTRNVYSGRSFSASCSKG